MKKQIVILYGITISGSTRDTFEYIDKNVENILEKIDYNEYGDINLSDENTHRVLLEYLENKYCFISGNNIEGILRAYIVVRPVIFPEKVQR